MGTMEKYTEMRDITKVFAGEYVLCCTVEMSRINKIITLAEV